MTDDIREDFEKRREAVLRQQMRSNPRMQAVRRRRRLAVVGGMVRYVLALGVLAFAIKAFLLSQYGVDGYLALVAPALQRLPEGGAMATLLLPDHYSSMVADTLASFRPAEVETVQTDLSGFARLGPQ